MELIRDHDQPSEETRPYANPDETMLPGRTRPYPASDGIIPSMEPVRDYTPSHETVVRHGLPEIVRAFKSFSARRINAARHAPGGAIRRTRGVPVWQRNYYEHIIRDEAAWARITAYIHNNPARWDQDRLHLETSENPYHQENP